MQTSRGPGNDTPEDKKKLYHNNYTHYHSRICWLFVDYSTLFIFSPWKLCVCWYQLQKLCSFTEELIITDGSAPSFKGTVLIGKKLFLNSTHLLDINFSANNNCSKVLILKKSKIHISHHFPRIDMGWRPLALVCLGLHVSTCLHSTRRRYIVSINMASN